MRVLLGHLLVPGYPQVRNGERGKAFLVGAALLLLALLAVATSWLRSPAGLFTFLGAVVAVGTWSLVDGRLHRGTGTRARLRAAEWAILALPVWLLVATLLVPPAREALLGLAAYKTPTGHDSMAPALQGGDRFVVDLRARTPSRGDLVVFRSPEEPLTLVKRVVALEGDVVEADVQGLKVNGRLALAGEAAPFGPLTVPAGGIFAVGDNLPRSRDCRHFGPVEFGAIRGRVLYVFWSGTWSRIGTTPG